jgi:hypothetical protein
MDRARTVDRASGHRDPSAVDENLAQLHLLEGLDVAADDAELDGHLDRHLAVGGPDLALEVR